MCHGSMFVLSICSLRLLRYTLHCGQLFHGTNLKVQCFYLKLQALNEKLPGVNLKFNGINLELQRSN